MGGNLKKVEKHRFKAYKISETKPIKNHLKTVHFSDVSLEYFKSGENFEIKISREIFRTLGEIAVLRGGAPCAYYGIRRSAKRTTLLQLISAETGEFARLIGRGFFALPRGKTESRNCAIER